jgi:phosphatidylserine decarboxylase
LGTVAIVLLVLVVLYAISHALLILAPLAVVLVFFGLLLSFFRDPERTVAEGIVAAADGRVMVVKEEGSRIRIGTFMNVTNVHVNRSPAAGYLVRVDTREGPRAPAYSPEATGNAQKRYLLGTPIGLVEVVQITGLIARRCVAYSRAGSPLRRGERFGMVLFGSRVDVVLPKDSVRVVVRVGTRVHAGSTTIAELVR